MLGCIWDARGAGPCREGTWRGFEADLGALAPATHDHHDRLPRISDAPLRGLGGAM